MTRAVCAVDTETDGTTWNRQTYEVAIVKRWPDGHTQESSWFLPIDLRHADPRVLEIGGFYDRHPEGIRLTTGRTVAAPSDPEVVARAVFRLTHNATIVGAQPQFDTHVLSCLLHRHGLQPSWHYRLYDVESLTAGHLKAQVGGLAKCADAMQIPFPEDQQHTALGDARVALAIYDAILGGTE